MCPLIAEGTKQGIFNNEIRLSNKKKQMIDKCNT